MYHSAGHGCGFENRYRVAKQGQIMRRGRACRARADHGNLLRVFRARLSGVDINGISRFRSEPLGHKAFQSTDGNRQVKLSTAASGFAWVTTHAPADGGEGI